MIEHWKRLIWEAAAGPTLATSGVRKISADVAFQLPWSALLASELNYQDICYTSAKGKQLARNYWNQEGVEAAIEKLEGRGGKDHSSVSIQLRSGVKDSRSQGYCMQNMVITVTPTVTTIDVYYRSTELVQKFLADLIFFSQVLPPIFKRLGLVPTVMRFKFANVYLSAVFMPIFMRYEEDPLKFFQHLRKHDPRFFRTCGLATRRFFTREHNYTYRTRVKMHNYWWQFVDPKKAAPLGKLLLNLKGEIPETEGDEE